MTYAFLWQLYWTCYELCVAQGHLSFLTFSYRIKGKCFSFTLSIYQQYEPVIFQSQVCPLNLYATAAPLIVSGRCNKKQIHNIDLWPSRDLCLLYYIVWVRPKDSSDDTKIRCNLQLKMNIKYWKPERNLLSVPAKYDEAKYNRETVQEFY